MRLFLRSAAVLVLGFFALAQTPFSMEDLRKIVTLSSVEIAPDGKTVAVVTSRPNYGENKHELQLCAIDVATGAVRELTHARKRVSAPAWSPDGEKLAFLAPDAQDKSQVWLLPIRGGESRALTSSSTGVEHFAWRPDSGAIAYSAADEAPKLEGEERHVATIRIGDQDLYLKEPFRPRHVWYQGTADESAKRLTSGDWTLDFALPPSGGASPLSWSPDGKRIAFTRAAAPESGKLDKRRAALLDVESGTIRMLDATDQFQGSARFTPDGRGVLVRQPRDGEVAKIGDFFVIDADGASGRNVTRGLDRVVSGVAWMPGGKEFLTASNQRESVGAWIVPLDPSAGASREVDLDGLVLSGASPFDISVSDGGVIAFTATRADLPQEVFVKTAATAKPRRLTQFNAWAAERSFARMERVTWKTSDGLEADGVIALPADLSTPRPLVLVIHGGPTSASKTSFTPLLQLMAAKGWVVFSPNYRGSDNLGHDFANAILGDAGEGPGRDVMEGIAELAKRSYVDRSRMAVTGWSYGGFMTTWLLGRYPKEWVCGVAGAAVTDWIDMYNYGDSNVRLRHRFGGSPHDPDVVAAYRAQSPISHASKIVAPTLIMTNLEDYRVPTTQSFALYHLLKDRGVETEFIGFPGRTHSSSDPVNARERMRLWIDWVERQFAVKKAAERAPSGTR